ncbi:MAG: hypothetical protein RIN55_05045 [Tissierellaceae bacterium]|nr:hypothetical protein [Tissierellaceae bacterium]
MSDILSAFAILLAVFTYIESLYVKFIQEGLNIEVKEHKRDNKVGYLKVKKIIINYQIPLLVISLIICLIMTPVSIEILVNSFNYLSAGIAKYDISSMSIILLHSLFIIIFIREIIKFIKLKNKLKILIYWS